jgi:hypothetical protein
VTALDVGFAHCSQQKAPAVHRLLETLRALRSKT